MSDNEKQSAKNKAWLLKLFMHVNDEHVAKLDNSI